jgi:haloacetate dehalogenase
VALFEGFEIADVDAGEATIHVRRSGSGPPLLLLHGHPQTGAMWHLVAPRLAERFTVVVPDLRGYGISSKPPSAPDHEPYSKRAFACDQLEVMRQLGFERFAVAGHDRGGRTAYRMALDAPERVSRLAVLDIVPTVEMWDAMDAHLAMENWHWLFLARPEPFPERIIGADPDAYYRHRLDDPIFDPEAREEYLAALRDPETIHAVCEDYRAGATFDREADARDRADGRRISCPLLVLWSEREDLAQMDPLTIWRRWAGDLHGRGFDAGHFLAEERPDEVLAELESFFTA